LIVIQYNFGEVVEKRRCGIERRWTMGDDAAVGWIAAIIIGGIAGWLAEQFMKSNMGLIMNIVLGIVGAAVASAIFSFFGIALGG
jgi:F0F1-type ATP synthase assembly protein I